MAGDCRDEGNILNEGNSRINSLDVSTIFVSQGCSIIFETDNVDRDWQISLRDLAAPEALEHFLEIEDGTSINGIGHQLTMGTLLPEGIWTVTANVADNYFILHSYSISSDCEDTVFNEGNSRLDSLEVSTVFRASTDCVIWWETDNVDGEWELIFEKLN